MWEIIRYQMISMLFHDCQDANGTHNVQAESAACAVEVDPEDVYDAFQCMI